MPQVWMPGCVIDRGLNAGYRSGRNAMRLVKVHKTAGNNSYGVCKNNGLCQWLVPVSGTPWQFAEADAVTYDSGPYNGYGPGVEIEAPVTGGLIRPGLSEFRDLTANQIAWTGRIFRWLHDEWGIPLALYDGPRFQGKGFVGFENHGDLDDQRTDGVTREEWDAMLGVLPEPDWAAIHAYVLALLRKKQRMIPVQVAGVGFFLLSGGGASPLPTYSDYKALCAATGVPETIIVTQGTVDLLNQTVTKNNKASVSGSAAGPLTVALSGTATPA